MSAEAELDMTGMGKIDILDYFYLNCEWRSFFLNIVILHCNVDDMIPTYSFYSNAL